MGLVKAALGAASGVMGDQWKEYFYCSALPAEVLAVKGQKKVSGRSSNRHGAENIITDGSIVAVAEGQCALIVEQGKVVDLCAEAGEYTYNTGTQPSLLSEGLAKNIDEVFAEIGKRFSFGGQASTATASSTPSCFTPMSAEMWKTSTPVTRWKVRCAPR